MRKLLLFIFTLLFFAGPGFSQTANLSITTTAGAGPYFQNNWVTFTLVATNHGPDQATNVIITDKLPENLEFIEVTGATGSYNAGNRTYTFNPVNLNAGTSVTYPLRARINDVPGKKFNHTVAIRSDVPDTDNTNNNYVLPDQNIEAVPANAADLVITKNITAGTVKPGYNITYTIKVKNNGPSAAGNVSITDILPANLTFVSATASTGTYNPNNGILNIGNLGIGEPGVTLTITATINTSGNLVNSAAVTGGPVDPDNTNNIATTKNCIKPDQPTRLEIGGSATTMQVCTGKTVQMKVPVVSGASGYNFAFPAGFTVVRQLGSVIEVTPGAAGGSIAVKAINACGESTPLQVPVTVSAAPVTPASISGSATPCSNAEVAYSITPVAGTTSYNWAVPTGWRIISGETTPNLLLRAGTVAGDIRVTVANNCGDGGSQTLAVTPVLTPAKPVSIIDSSSACNGLRYVVEPVANVTSYTWSVPADWIIQSGQGTRAIIVTAPNARATGQVSVIAENETCKSPATVYAADASRGDGNLNFPNAFSPNGDNYNDTYVIGNLHKYPDNDILILNRWGNQVYKKVNYQNDWDAKDLSEGTYFYVVRIKVCNEEQKIFKGYITIAR